jgi:hypothetical protein
MEIKVREEKDLLLVSDSRKTVGIKWKKGRKKADKTC